MKKYSLINVEEDFGFKFQEGDEIIFEMPSFCSGDYATTVKKDENYGLYVEDQWFEGCRDFYVRRNGVVLDFEDESKDKENT
jgi:hypothetical protein